MLLDGTNITLGTCYYPEHWERSIWADDLTRMKEAGISVVRVAEFGKGLLCDAPRGAWNLPPRQGGGYPGP